MKSVRGALLLVLCGVTGTCAVNGPGEVTLAAQVRPASQVEEPMGSAHFGFGRLATSSEIAVLDIDVRPDGAGLPPGRGRVADGETTYAARCAVCHGKTGKEGPNDVLVGYDPRQGFPFARNPGLSKTIGSYWPYATTLFDYLRRAMPLDAPGSLENDEIYSLVAYLLFLNELMPADAALDATSLPKMRMPARDRFVVDPRGGPNSLRGAPQPWR